MCKTDFILVVTMFFALFLLLLSNLSAHTDVVTSLRKADRYVREATDDKAQEALQKAHDAIEGVNPSDPLLVSLQDRLERYTQGAARAIESLATEDDLTYLKIEKRWREGAFWQAKKALDALMQRLCSASSPAPSMLVAQCVYLQAEMECMQGNFLPAYRAYTQAREFPQSAYAPWYCDALLKAIYCLLLSPQGSESFSARVNKAEHLIAQLKSQRAAALLALMEPLHARPVLRQTLRTWREQWAAQCSLMCACVPSLQAYHVQSAQWSAVKEVMHKEADSALAEEAVLRFMHTFPDGLYLADSLHALARLALKKGDVQKAREWKHLLETCCPNAPQCAESTFCFARDAEERGDALVALRYDREGWTRFSESAFAAESAFLSYPYQDYVEGKPDAVAHLLALEEHFPRSRYALLSRYVRALRDLYPPCGVRANPLAALSILAELVELSKAMHREGDVPEEELEEVSLLVTRALFEQAQGYRMVAKEAKEAKKNLFLAYSQAAYEQLIERLKSEHLHPEAYGTLKEECELMLAECAADLGSERAARAILQALLKELDRHNASHQRIFARSFYALAASHARLLEDEEALKYLKETEQYMRGELLSAEERFDILFLQSRVHRRCGHLDEALRSLSDIINDPSVSPRRFQALYERAEIFCEQGRLGLAKRQWQALLTEGSIWAEKARKHLE